MVPTIANAQSQILVLWHADGSSTDVDLYTEPKVTFTDSTLLITSTVLDIMYAADEIIRFTFKGKGTGIDVPKSEADFWQENDRIVFHKIVSADRVAIYRPDGIQIPVHLTIECDDTVLPLSSLPRGTYIINVNGRTSKFIRK